MGTALRASPPVGMTWVVARVASPFRVVLKSMLCSATRIKRFGARLEIFGGLGLQAILGCCVRFRRDAKKTSRTAVEIIVVVVVEVGSSVQHNQPVE